MILPRTPGSINSGLIQITRRGKEREKKGSQLGLEGSAHSGHSGSRQQGLTVPQRLGSSLPGLALVAGLCGDLTGAAGVKGCGPRSCTRLTALMSVSCPGLAQGSRTSPVVLAEDYLPELGDVSGKGRGEPGESPLKFMRLLAPKSKIDGAFRVSGQRKAGDTQGLTSPRTQNGPAQALLVTLEASLVPPLPQAQGSCLCRTSPMPCFRLFWQ